MKHALGYLAGVAVELGLIVALAFVLELVIFWASGAW